MTAVAEQVIVYFDIPATGGDWFTLDDPVRGVLDDPNPLAGEQGFDISAESFDYSISRGRSTELDEIQTGRLTLQLRNYDARFFPSIYNVQTLTDELLDDDDDELVTDGDGEPVLLEDGTPWLLEDGTPLTYGPGDGEVLYSDEESGFGATDQVKPGRRIKVVSEGVTIFDGSTEDWTFTYDSSKQVDCGVDAVDPLGLLARRFFTAWTTTDGDTPRERILDVLNRPEVQFGPSIDLDEGASILQDDAVSYGSNVLNYLQLVAKTDLGRLFAARDGVLTFRSRASIINPTVKARFTDVAGDGVPFRNISFDVASALLFTDVTVDRVGGIAQHVYDDDARTEFGIRALQVTGVLLSDDSASLDSAQYQLGQYKTPQLRIGSLTVRLDALTSEQRALVNRLDIGDVVYVLFTPTGSVSAMERNLVIEGVSHQASTDGAHDVTFRLSLVQQQAMFVLDDPVLGVLDSGVLAF